VAAFGLSSAVNVKDLAVGVGGDYGNSVQLASALLANLFGPRFHVPSTPREVAPIMTENYTDTIAFAASGHDCKRWYLRPMIDYLVD
jgi:hypothetical protein